MMDKNGNPYLVLSDGQSRFKLIDNVSGLENRSFSNMNTTEFHALDVTADGITDLVVMRSDNQHYLAVGQGDQTFNAIDDMPGLDQINMQSIGEGHITHLVGDFDANSQPEILSIKTDGRHWMAHLKRRVPKLFSITDGMGNTAKLYYSTINQPNVYDKTEHTGYPNTTLPGVGELIYKVSQEVMDNVYQDTLYKYQDLKIDLRTGSLGFRTRQVNNTTTGMTQVTEYNQDWSTRQVGMPLVENTIGPNGARLSTTVNEYATLTHGQTLFPYVSRSTTTTRDLDSSVFATTTTEQLLTTSYDVFHPLTERTTVCVTDQVVVGSTAIACNNLTGKHQTSIKEYDYFPRNQFGTQLAARVKTERSTSTLHGVSLPFGQATSQTKTKGYEYHSGTGALKKEIIEPNNTVLGIYTEHQYNAKGQTIRVLTAPLNPMSDLDWRWSDNVYETSGLYRLKEKKNTLGHKTATYGYTDSRFPWQATTVTDVNNQTVSTAFDSFGESETVQYPNQTSKQTLKYWCHDGCGVGASYKISTTITQGPGKTTYFDAQGRELRSEMDAHESINSIATRVVDKIYDYKGRLTSVSEPYFQHQGSPVYTSTTFDLLDRPLTVTHANGTQVTHTYQGKTTKEVLIPTDDVSRETTRVTNVLGQKVQVIDPLNSSLTFLHDPFGNLVRTTDPQGNNIDLEYNIRGHKTRMSDPDQGNWSYQYYEDGSLWKQTDAKHQVTESEYDRLGRLERRTSSGGESARWFYDNCANGIGKVCSVTNSSGFTDTFYYNAKGLQYKKDRSISGTNSITTETTFDTYDRVRTVSYAGIFRTRHEYSSIGVLKKVVNDISGQNLWEAKDFNERGQLTGFNQGSLVTSRWYENTTGRLTKQMVHQSGSEISEHDYVWTNIGNLDNKTHQWKNQPNKTLYEYYEYDLLSRLTDYSTDVGSNRISTVNLNYDSLGNITYKSDVGSYTYGSSRPHAVTNVSSIGDFNYDTNGNMTGGSDRTIQYTAFNKPKTITKDGVTTRIEYGPDRSRYKRVDTGATSSTIYYSGAYEIESKSGSTYHRVNLGHTILEKKDSTLDTVNLIKDHLGSIIGTYSSSKGFTRSSFDPWGKRRNLNIYDNEMLGTDLVSLMGHVTQRGFTGHEMLSGTGLVHMGGRVFDPTIARFISADPHIQAPYNTQSYNRYSYVLNNPMAYTDPSGYFFKKLFKKVKRFVKKYWRPLLSIATTIALPGSGFLTAALDTANTAAHAMAAGFIGGGIGSGNLKGAVIGAWTGGMLDGIGAAAQVKKLKDLGKVFAHSLVGGISSYANGGKFGHGFAAMGLTAGANVKFDGKLGYAGSAAVGGLASVIAGGKFSHGAVAGVFSYGLNDRFHQRRMQKRISIETSVDGDYHEYRLRGKICSLATSGCNAQLADKVFEHVNRNDIPFTDRDLVVGNHEIGPFNDPIRHEQLPADRISVNVALEGHQLYPGTVTHKVHFENGALYYDVTGVGTGKLPRFNNFLGVRLFSPGVRSVVHKFGI